MVFFTVLAGGLFAAGTLAMTDATATLPVIHDQMLQLMGISNGVYVGFKIPGKSI